MSRDAFHCLVLAVILALTVFSLWCSLEPQPRPRLQPMHREMQILIPVPQVPERIQGHTTRYIEV